MCFMKHIQTDGLNYNQKIDFMTRRVYLKKGNFIAYCDTIILRGSMKSFIQTFQAKHICVVVKRINIVLAFPSSALHHKRIHH